MRQIFLLLLLIILLIKLFQKIKKKENMTNTIIISSDTTTTEWSDINQECLKRDENNCNIDENCVWKDDIKKCLENNFKCELYNNDFLNLNYEKKKIHCENAGCKFTMDKQNGKLICIEPEYKNIKEVCYENTDILNCNSNKNCNWNNQLNKCLYKLENSDDYCKSFNSNEFKINNICRNENTNKYNCYVDLKRDVNNFIIPFTGLNEFKKRKCRESGCKIINVRDSNTNICVNQTVEDDIDLCFNYFKDKPVSYYNCNQIGCSYYSGLNKEYGGLCYADRIAIENNNSINNNIICNQFTNDPYQCTKIGCKFEDGKCHN